MRKAYHLPGCGEGVIKPLKWWLGLDDKHGYKTVVKSATCKACMVKLQKEGVFDGPSNPTGA